MLENNAAVPTAVLLLAVALASKALAPTAVFADSSCVVAPKDCNILTASITSMQLCLLYKA